MENNKITVGEIIRDFFGLLNVLQKKPQVTIEQLLGTPKNETVTDKNDSELDAVFKRFESM